MKDEIMRSSIMLVVIVSIIDGKKIGRDTWHSWMIASVIVFGWRDYAFNICEYDCFCD